jgi:integrase-like protein
VNTLSYSRRFHFWRTQTEDAEHTYEGLVRAFEWFGGAPGEVWVDNQKSAVLVHSGEGAVRFHSRFVDLAGHYGFAPRACRPARAQTKGKDEQNVGYVKHRFFVRYRAFESWAHLNQLAEQWLREGADRRVHGTVHEVVAELHPGSADALTLAGSTVRSPARRKTRPSIFPINHARPRGPMPAKARRTVPSSQKELGPFLPPRPYRVLAPGARRPAASLG